MTYICFVRHGETEWNIQQRLQGTTDTPLTPIGQIQAEMTALFLKKQEWDHIITSPLKRAVQTAEIIAKELEIPSIKKWQEFKERDYGEATGLYINEYKTLKASQRRIKNWESDEELLHRVISGLEKLLKDHENEKIIIISHGVPILTALEFIQEKPLQSDHDIFHLKNGCLSSIYYKYSRWHIEQYNVIDHLEDLKLIKAPS